MARAAELQTRSTSSTPRSLSELDISISLYLHKNIGSRLPRSLFMLLEHSGNGVLWLLIVPAAWRWLPVSYYDRCCLANLFVGLWVDLALVGTLKSIFKRPRPAYNLSRDFIMVVAVDKHSFPSGHAARVTFIAAFATLCLLGRSIMISTVVGAWALITALSRALMGRHYLGDVLAGLCTGLITTAIVTKGTYSPSHLWLSEAYSEIMWRDLYKLSSPG